MCLFLDPTCSIVVIKIAAMLQTNFVYLRIVNEAHITDSFVIFQKSRLDVLAQVYIEEFSAFAEFNAAILCFLDR